MKRNARLFQRNSSCRQVKRVDRQDPVPDGRSCFSSAQEQFGTVCSVIETGKSVKFDEIRRNRKYRRASATGANTISYPDLVDMFEKNLAEKTLIIWGSYRDSTINF
jgi:hypothetical protein